MIELKVEEYCHNCPSFEPEKGTSHSIEIENVVAAYNTHVICKYRRRCAAMYRYLQRCELNKEVTNSGQN